MRTSQRVAILCALCALCMSTACRRSTIRLDTNEKLKARVLNGDKDNVYVLTKDETVRVLPRAQITSHRPPGTLTSIAGGFYAVAYGGILLSMREDIALEETLFFSGLVLGSVGVAVTGGVIRRRTQIRYRRGLSVEQAVKQVSVIPMVGRKRAGVLVRF